MTTFAHDDETFLDSLYAALYSRIAADFSGGGGGGGGAVASVNGETGVVVLTADNIDPSASRLWLSAARAAAIDGAAPAAQPITATRTTATVNPVVADAGHLIPLSRASAQSFVLPADATEDFALGSFLEVLVLGTGQVTFTAGAGATLIVSGLTAKSRAQESRIGVQKVDADTWNVFGDLAAS